MDRLKLNGAGSGACGRQLRSTRDVRLYRRTLAILELDQGGRPVTSPVIQPVLGPRLSFEAFSSESRDDS